MPQNETLDARHVVQALLTKGFIDKEKSPDLYRVAGNPEVRQNVASALEMFGMKRREQPTHGIIVALNRSQAELSRQAAEEEVNQLVPVFPTHALTFQQSVTLVILRSAFDEEATNVKSEFAGYVKEGELIEMLTAVFPEDNTGDGAKFAADVLKWLRVLQRHDFVEKGMRDNTDAYRISRLGIAVFDRDTCARFRRACSDVLDQHIAGDTADNEEEVRNNQDA